MSGELARRYVELSNEHDLDSIAEMFAEEATYRSARVGEFTGREAVLDMMRGFFRRYPDVQWDVPGYREAGPRRVTFDYEIRGTDAESGDPLTGSGTEAIEFDPDGRILHVEVG